MAEVGAVLACQLDRGRVELKSHPIGVPGGFTSFDPRHPAPGGPFLLIRFENLLFQHESLPTLYKTTH